MPVMFSRASHSLQFPLYLLPSSPFRNRWRRPSNENSTLSCTPSGLGIDATSTAGEGYFLGSDSHLQCARCAVDICLKSQIISKGFTGRHGRAYLVAPSHTVTSTIASPGANKLGLPNTKTESPSQRQLVTGIHTVSDVRCAFCASMLGWKYDGAEEESQRYKVGKYILETKMVCTSSDWETDDSDRLLPNARSNDRTEDHLEPREIEFDSQDEEECEDLFAGEWSPYLASRRRQARNFHANPPGKKEGRS